MRLYRDAKNRQVVVAIHLSHHPFYRLVLVVKKHPVEAVRPQVEEVGTETFDADQCPDSALPNQFAHLLECRSVTRLVAEGQPHAARRAHLVHPPGVSPGRGHWFLAVDQLHPGRYTCQHRIQVQPRPQTDTHHIRFLLLEQFPVILVVPRYTQVFRTLRRRSPGQVGAGDQFCIRRQVSQRMGATAPTATDQPRFQLCHAFLSSIAVILQKL